MLVFDRFDAFNIALKFADYIRENSNLRADVYMRNPVLRIPARPSVCGQFIVVAERPGEEVDRPEDINIGEDGELLAILKTKAAEVGAVCTDEE